MADMRRDDERSPVKRYADESPERMTRLREHARHEHDIAPRYDCPACRKFAGTTLRAVKP
jgi:hypothetical protein